MRFASATTTKESIEAATHHILHQIADQEEHPNLDLVLLFLSPHFENAAAYVTGELRRELAPQVLLGCTSEGIIGRSQELENQPAITCITADLPGVRLKPFALHPEGLDDVLDEPSHFLKTVAAPNGTQVFITIGDPYSMRMPSALSLFNAFYADVPVVGGMTSAPQGQNALFFGDRILTGGAVGVALAGDLDVDVVVSQGCRPVGPTYTITEAKENIILGLDGLPPILHVEELVSQLSEDDRIVLENGLFVGRAIDTDGDRLGRGDFLIRGLMGVDQQSGALAVADYVQSGETIQFHLHDAATAQEDLELMLTPQVLFGRPSGALLFSCSGRGTNLYDKPDGDVSVIQRYLNNVHLAGLFCAGEIGPIGGRNFLHGNTACMVMFRPGTTDQNL